VQPGLLVQLVLLVQPDRRVLKVLLGLLEQQEQLALKVQLVQPDRRVLKVLLDLRV
jgi:hypothetical protein